MAKGRNEQQKIINQYCAVNMITDKSEVNKSEHQKIINGALMDVWSYQGLFKGETEETKAKRLALSSPKEGSVTELAQHFKGLPGTAYEFATPSWFVIFTQFNQMNESKEGSASSVETTSESLHVDSSDRGTQRITESSVDSSDKNNSTEGEKEMAENSATIQQLMEAEERANAGYAEVAAKTEGTGVETKPVQSSAAMKAASEAAMAHLEKERAERLAFSKSAVVKKIVWAKQPAEKILVEGEKAQGTIANPDAVYKTFEEKFDPAKGDNGEITFKGAKPGMENQQRAMDLYNAIQAAKADPNKKFEAYVTKNLGTPKGAIISLPNGTEEVYSRKSITQLLLDKSAGFVKASDPNIEIRVSKAQPKRQKPTGAKTVGNVREEKKSNDVFRGVLTLQFVNVKEAYETMAVFHREMTGETENGKGIKSKLSASYTRAAKTTSGDPQYGTWRIPLVTQQYKLTVKDSKLQQVFGDGTTVGQRATPTDVNDEKAMADLFTELSGIQAQLAINNVGGEGSLMDKIREDISASAEKELKAQSEAVAEDAAEL